VLTAFDNLDQRKDQFRAWLSTSANSVLTERITLLEHQRKSQPNWVLELPQFKRWHEDENAETNILWLTATAGYGKSVIAAYLTQKLVEIHPSCGMSYYFCKDKDGPREGHELLRTLLYQLSETSEALESKAQSIWSSNRSIADLSANIEYIFDNLFLPCISTLPRDEPIFVVIDGFNELPRAQMERILAVVRMFQRLYANSDIPALRVVLCSQPIKSEKTGATLHMSLTSLDNLDNIEWFVKNTISQDIANLFKQGGVDPINYFREHSRGMFLWVSLILRDLETMDTYEDMKEILDNPPDKINDTYQSILERLHRDNHRSGKNWIREIITWVVTSKRDLTLPELEAAILVSQGKREFRDFRATVGKCSAILQVVRSTRANQHIVTLVHDTFKQFITNADQSTGPRYNANIFLVRPAQAEAMIASSCLSYLGHNAFDDICSDDESLETRVQTYKLCLYAAQFWGAHTRGEAESLPCIRQAVFQLLGSENRRNSILQMTGYADLSRRYWLNIPKGQTLLHIIARNGLATICRHLLDQRPNYELYSIDLK